MVRYCILPGTVQYSAVQTFSHSLIKMITRHRSDNEDAIIKQLIMETPRKNVNKDGICLLGSRPIDPKQRTQR